MSAKPRIYGSWAGNPKATPEDKTRCIEQVTPNDRAGIMHAHQCYNPRGHGPDGLYCRIHDPAAVKRRQQVRAERWERKFKSERDLRARLAAAEAVCEAVTRWRRKHRATAADMNSFSLEAEIAADDALRAALAAWRAAKEGK